MMTGRSFDGPRGGKGVRFGQALTALAAILASGTAAWAQPADLPIPAATTTEYPAGVSVGKAGGVPVYVASDGRTLYGMDMRTVLRWGPDASKYCQGPCAELWEPLLAPEGSKPNIMFPRGFGSRMPEGFLQNQKAPDWTIIEGPQGAQWVYKGWHMVYVRKGEAPGSAAHEGEDNLTWNTLKFVPPVPKLTAPVNVSTAFVDGAYALVDNEGRLLYTGDCHGDCAVWRPFAGGMASRGVGDWTVSRNADSAQWLYRGKPAFVAQGSSVADLPAGAAVLRP
jgi:predicted lipoprotein with Yx(FWY)xxD motif